MLLALRYTLILLFSFSYPVEAKVFESAGHKLKIETLIEGRDVLWGIDFLSDKELIVSERNGKIFIYNLETKAIQEVQGVPEVSVGGQGGLLDILVHPNPKKKSYVYISYSVRIDGGRTTRVSRATLKDASLQNLEVLFTASLPQSGGVHFGSRLQIDEQDYLYITVGDRGQRNEAQNLNSHLGKLLRLHDDGKVPETNPFVGRKDAKPEIWSYGHRNAQGLRLHPETKQLWLHEHGPRGGDELNLIKKAANYGWPKVSHGREYYGPRISSKTEMEGVENPVMVYTPSIAPSGFDFYFSDHISGWKGNALIGALVLRHVNRVAWEGAKALEKERLLSDFGERIRSVRVASNGFVYLGTDSGKLLKISLAP